MRSLQIDLGGSTASSDERPCTHGKQAWADALSIVSCCHCSAPLWQALPTLLAHLGLVAIWARAVRRPGPLVRPLTSVRDPSRLEQTTSQHPSPSISICLRRRSYLFLLIHNIPILCPLLLSDRKDSLHSSLPHLLPHRPAYFTHNVVPSCVSLLPLFPACVSGALFICRTVFADALT